MLFQSYLFSFYFYIGFYPMLLISPLRGFLNGNLKNFIFNFLKPYLKHDKDIVLRKRHNLYTNRNLSCNLLLFRFWKLHLLDTLHSNYHTKNNFRKRDNVALRKPLLQWYNQLQFRQKFLPLFQFLNVAELLLLHWF